MTISTTASTVQAEGNGVTTSFAYSFLMPNALVVVVQILDTTVTPATVTALTATQYSITGLGNAVGGTVTYPLSGPPLASGQFITITRVVPYQQLVTIADQGNFYPQVVETMGDSLEMQIQQIAAGLDRSIQYNSVDPGPFATLPPAATLAGQLLGFDSLGNPIAAQPGSAIVSLVMQPVVAASSLTSAASIFGVPRLVQNNPFSGNNTFAGTSTFTGGVYGGSTSGAKLILTSSTSNAGADAIVFRTANGLATPALATTGISVTPLSSWAEFDTRGRYVQIVGTPTTVVFPNSGGTWGASTPYQIFNQPTGTDMSLIVTGTYAGMVTANMVAFTVYASGNQQYVGGGSVTALVGSGCAIDTNSAVQGVTANATALATGAIAVAMVAGCNAYAASTDTIALLLVAGGDSINPCNSLITLESGAAGNSANNLIVLNGNTINPLQPTGSIMTTSGTHVACAYGIDFANVSIGNAAWRSSGVTIDGSGIFLINTGVQQFSVTERISVGGGAVSVAQGDSTTAALYLGNQKAGNVTNLSIEAWNGATWSGVGGITNTGSTTAFVTSSDGRLKDLIGTLNGGSVVDALDAVEYTWKEGGGHSVGFIAQDVAALISEGVEHGDDGPLDGPDFSPWMLDKSALIPYLWADHKALKAQNAALKDRVAALEILNA